jgi:hypothetical protein
MMQPTSLKRHTARSATRHLLLDRPEADRVVSWSSKASRAVAWTDDDLLEPASKRQILLSAQIAGFLVALLVQLQHSTPSITRVKQAQGSGSAVLQTNPCWPWKPVDLDSLVFFDRPKGIDEQCHPVASFASLSAPRFRHTSTPCVGHVHGFHHCTKGAHTKPMAGTRLLGGVV